MFIGCNPVGMTVREFIDMEGDEWPNGISIMELESAEDTCGEAVGLSYSTERVLHRRPDLWDATIMHYNWFFGELVLRVLRKRLFDKQLGGHDNAPR